MDRDMSDLNKATVLEAFDTLFNKRDFARAEQFWSTDYIQPLPVPIGQQAGADKAADAVIEDRAAHGGAVDCEARIGKRPRGEDEEVAHASNGPSSRLRQQRLEKPFIATIAPTIHTC